MRVPVWALPVLLMLPMALCFDARAGNGNPKLTLLVPQIIAANLAPRFAIDRERIDDKNTLAAGDVKLPANYRIYGKPTLVAADGTVVGARNDLEDQVPGALSTNLTVDEAGTENFDKPRPIGRLLR